MLDRRSFGLSLLASLASAAAPQNAAAQPATGASKLVLIGTKGGPRCGFMR